MGRKSEQNTNQAPVNDDVNTLMLRGKVLRAKQLEKVCRFTLDVSSVTKTGAIAHAYIPVVWFNGDTEDTATDGERVSITGSLRSGSYEKDGKKVYTLDAVVDTIEFE